MRMIYGKKKKKKTFRAARELTPNLILKTIYVKSFLLMTFRRLPHKRCYIRTSSIDISWWCALHKPERFVIWLEATGENPVLRRFLSERTQLAGQNGDVVTFSHESQQKLFDCLRLIHQMHTYKCSL